MEYNSDKYLEQLKITTPDKITKQYIKLIEVSSKHKVLGKLKIIINDVDLKENLTKPDVTDN